MGVGADAEGVAVVGDAWGSLALWPAGRDVPPGWAELRPAGDRAAALAFISARPPEATRPRPGASLHETVPARLAALARARPDAPALALDDLVVTRGELDRQATGIAAALLARGVGPEEVVAVAAARTPLAVAGFLGVLRAGAAFLPVDPSHPRERVAGQIADAGVRVALADAAGAGVVPAGLRPVDLAAAAAGDPAAPAAPPPPAEGGRLAYVIYTSGSTGRPKGVMVEHGPLAMHVAATADAYDMDAASRELHALSFAFDGAHERWMVPLYAGGCVVLRGAAAATAADTLAALRRHRVTHAGFPTSFVPLLAAWAASLGEAPRLRCLSFGGEAMARATFADAARHLRPEVLINGYGPTEAVISPLVWKVPATAEPFPEPYAPIGRPVGDRRAYVLDGALAPVADGEAGELWLGGGGLARGYLGRPDLTAERFLPDPFAADGGRMYRTGDVVRRRPDGTLGYVGREDGQVKVRGHRIELGEVEARLREQPGVAEAVVVKRRGPAGDRLVGYVTGRAGAAPDPDRLRLALGAALHPAAVPRPILVVGALPLTPNGKVDRAALPDPAPPRSAPPRTDTERRIAALWGEALNVAEVGRDVAFGAMGGDSLAALRLLAGMHLAFPHATVGVGDLLSDPTVADLAALVDAGGCEAADDPGRIVTLNPGEAGVPAVVLFPGLLVGLREYLPLVRRLGGRRPALGFACASLAAEPRRLPPVADLADAYAAAVATRVGPEGCFLVGWSWGGPLAFETARRLAGRVPVHRVMTLDSCGLGGAFAFGPPHRLGAAERERVGFEVEAWLSRSSMRQAWDSLLDGADPPRRDRVLRHLDGLRRPLPVDGPGAGSAERILFTLVDHALLMLDHAPSPAAVALTAFEAEASRADRLPVIDWGALASPVTVERVPGADHFDVVLSTLVHDAVSAICSARDARDART